MLAIVATLRLSGQPHHVVIAGQRAAVADHTNASLAVFDVARRELLATVAVGSRPHGVAADRSGFPPLR